jgi:hypothetical protein
MSGEGTVVDTATSGNETIDFLIERSRLLWALAIAFFGGGDLLTTTVGITTGWAAEMGPLAAVAIAEYGLLMMLPLKLGTFAVCYAAWLAVSTPYHVGIPLGLASLGVYVTGHNLYVLGMAASIVLF